ncbi:retrovirus-related pol polyprotein from transposon TNT 1-94 [Tanacetum coccineum]
MLAMVNGSTSPKERELYQAETQDSSNKCVSETVTGSKTKQTTSSVPTEVKDTEEESKLNELTKLFQMLIDEKILKEKAKLFPQCTHCGFNDHIPDDCRNNREDTSGRPSSTWTVDAHGFDDKQGTIFNANKEIVLIAPRRNDVYVLDMSSLTPNGVCFFAKPQKVMVENQNDVKVKQIRTDNRTEFRNHELKSFCDEKGISQNFFSPYTPEQNGIAKRKKRTLIEAARTMLNGLVLSKHFWTDAVRIACYTQNRSIIVKIHDKTSYEIFRERILDISYFYVFGCPVFIHNHKDHLSKFDAKVDDGYFLGYSSVS